MTTVFLFPGQGSQAVGMGRSLHDEFAVAREVFEEADEALGESLSTLCFEGPEDALRLTHNTQPTILTVSVAAYRVLESIGVRPDIVAGHSLGEYSALVCAGAIGLTEAVRAVRQRGQFMQEAVPDGVGGMLAVIGLDVAAVTRICTDVAEETDQIVSPANFNGHAQIVVAGHSAAVDEVGRRAKSAGAKMAKRLAVSAPFHCGLMAPAAERMDSVLAKMNFDDLAVPCVTNVDAELNSSGAAARDALRRQITGPVRWVESVERIAEEAPARWLEVGPGRVLSGLVGRIIRGTRPTQVGEAEAIGRLEER